MVLSYQREKIVRSTKLQRILNREVVGIWSENLSLEVYFFDYLPDLFNSMTKFPFIKDIILSCYFLSISFYFHCIYYKLCLISNLF